MFYRQCVSILKKKVLLDLRVNVLSTTVLTLMRILVLTKDGLVYKFIYRQNEYCVLTFW